MAKRRVEDVEEVETGIEVEPEAVDWFRVVKVRVLCEQGLLASRAVYRDEVHQVRWWQWLEAHEVHLDGYELVEE